MENLEPKLNWLDQNGKNILLNDRFSQMYKM